MIQTKDIDLDMKLMLLLSLENATPIYQFIEER